MKCCLTLGGLWMLLAAAAPAAEPAVLLCDVVDAASGRPIPCRVYAQDAAGRWLFARAVGDGTAVVYDKQRFERSIEKHVTVSAHRFAVDAPAGPLRLRIERGKECLPHEQVVQLAAGENRLTVRLRRWIDMAARGWYSGDTHVHRSLQDLPNVVLAEDLNVALPLTYWVTKSGTAPSSEETEAVLQRFGGAADRAVAPEVLAVDPLHVIYPVNTEYEIFTVGGRRHTLGAVFALGHRRPFTLGVPPVRQFVAEARAQGALLDLDKHSWPWSLMLVPVAEVDLFELANNHCWRTEFGFRGWTRETVPEYMQIEADEGGLTEWGWHDFTWKTYYALLNSGFRMRPSAGTASGVHPVPLGFGRVYVRVEGEFTYRKWMDGLRQGRSFVSTGPMLLVTVDGDVGGGERKSDGPRRVRVRGEAISSVKLKPLQIVVGGDVVQRVAAVNRPGERGEFVSPIDVELELDASTWVAVRALEDHADQRVRFAHSSPVHVVIDGLPARPKRAEVDYLIARMEQELQRNQAVLSDAALDEYRQALAKYQRLRDRAK